MNQYGKWMQRIAGLALITLLAWSGVARADTDTECARVKIEIDQTATLERQAFDAKMSINNTTTSAVLTGVSVVVNVTDELGAPVPVTFDPNDTNAKFFIRVASKQAIDDVDGNGVVQPQTSAVIDWLLIPAPGAAGASVLGKKYLVGATLVYTFNGDTQTVIVSPAVITVKPLPLLTLDYFLPTDVLGDDPLTPEIEPIVPFTLGVRIQNNGIAPAKSMKIDSAQPKIVENNQGLLINFKIDGSYVGDAPVANTLLMDFGDIPGNSSKMGRWVMETSLAGRFTEFTATFTHADELGGAVTSLLQAVNTHQLIQDVRVDLPGRDMVKDFLAQDGDVIRVYESDGPDTVVTNMSANAQFTAGTSTDGSAAYHLSIPPTDGFVYVKLVDPFNGTRTPGPVTRSDAKVLAAENVWLSQTRDPATKQWHYFVNFFDVNTPGNYDTSFTTPTGAALPPQIQFIPDLDVNETQQASFLVQASSPSGKPVTLTAAPLPTGAIFTQQAADPAHPSLASAIFDWTPARGMAGTYLVVYTANDGVLTATRTATVKVESGTPPPGPGALLINQPLSGAHVTLARPALSVLTPTDSKDPTTKVQFEVYSDEAMSQLVTSGTVAAVAPLPGNGGSPVAQPTVFTPTLDLNDATHYWWRARGFDGGTMYGQWVSATFYVGLFNHVPEPFNATTPAAGAEVDNLMPTLSWTNSTDRDGDVITYGVKIFKDAGLSQLQAHVANLPENPLGSSSWTVDTALSNHGTYYWQVIATDAIGGQTSTPARIFIVNTGNVAPTAPVLQSPADGGTSINPTTQLVVTNASDADGDAITLRFEIDTVSSFDSAHKQASGPIPQSGGASTSWTVTNLVENAHYFWRVKASDGRAESDWVQGSFLMNAVNDPPPAPTQANPSNGSWSGTITPVLQANPVLDPEGDAVSYQFQIYLDTALNSIATSGSSTTPSWTASGLKDDHTYYWRVKASDSHGASSAWSALSKLYVSTGPYTAPTIQVTSPATPIAPDLVTGVDGVHKTATLRFTGTDVNIEPTVALYYGSTNTGYAGQLITDGLGQPSGTTSGSYVWDVTGLAPGAYYVYGMIYDSRGVGKAYAPGAVVIPKPVQTGALVVAPPQLASGGPQTMVLAVHLAVAPVAPVTVSLSLSKAGTAVSPAALTFTPQNWSANQNITISGKPNCVRGDNQQFQLLFGKLVSLDPNYIGAVTPASNIQIVTNTGIATVGNNPNLSICRITVVSRSMVGLATNYVINSVLMNSGPAITGGVDATLNVSALNAGFGVGAGQITVSGPEHFGAVGAGESAIGSNIMVHSPQPLPDALWNGGLFTWTATTH